MTTSDAAPRLVVVPLGSWEQHGPHLPPDTDTVIISAVVAAACSGRSGVVVAPAVTISASDEHAGFANTLSTGTEAFAASLAGIARSAGWAGGIVFANGHGGNHDAIVAARETLEREGVRHSFWSLTAHADADLHAGRTETSVMLHLQPGLVDMSRAVAGNTDPAASVIERMREGGIAAVSQSGVLGDATAATEGLGREVFSEWVASLSAHIDRALADVSLRQGRDAGS